MTTIGAWMVGGGRRKRERSDADFYPTRPEAAWPFLARVAPVIGSAAVWEPACGDGVLGRTMQAAGLTVIGSDLHEYGWDGQQMTADFRHTVVPLGRFIVTNPPFDQAAEFAEHALRRLRVDGLGLLLKANFWHVGKHVGLYRRFPPVRCYPLAWRVDFTGEGASTMDLTWFWWGPAPEGPSEPLERPKALPAELHGIWQPPAAMRAATRCLQGSLAV